MDTLYLLIFLIAFYIITVYFIMLTNKKRNPSPKKNKNACDFHGCSSLDPVSDPVYNMQQIVKQSILLEEHLTNENKRCRDCITKHFLHIIGLAEEAQMLATNKSDKYPLLNENVELYNRLFKEWLNCEKKDPGKDIKKILSTCDELRTNRKKLIVYYFFDERNNLTDSEVRKMQG